MDQSDDAKMPSWRRCFARNLTPRRLVFILVALALLITLRLTSLIGQNTRKFVVPYSSQPFIAVDTTDGRRLGNVMFSYASMLGIAMTNNLTAIMPASFSLSSIFKLKVPLVENLDAALGNYDDYVEFGHRGSAYDFDTRRMKRKNTKLMGYYQSWMYYEHKEPAIRDHLQFQDHILDNVKEFMEQVSPDKSRIRIGLHVRRGDMLDEYFKNYGYLTPPPDYYATAMKYFETRFGDVQFIICSDDIAWAKANIHGEHVVYSEGHSEAEDMCILSLCNHTIVSVGSFGWWGAFLAGGVTVYYDKWPKEYSKLEYHVDKRTYFPEDWVPLH